VRSAQVHSLQIALSRNGYSCHEEELQWWQFGDTTFSALITFQVHSWLHAASHAACQMSAFPASHLVAA